MKRRSYTGYAVAHTATNTLI